jgi:monoterpene epsilon-lactone hydrolase
MDTKAFARGLSLRAYSWVTSTFFRHDSQPQRMRARFEHWAGTPRDKLQRKYPQLRFEDHPIGPLAMESVCAVAAPRCVILHLHGGAFIFGSVASYRSRALRFSFRCNAEVFIPDYRLAPEHPFPAALDDALVAFQYICALRPNLPIFVTGDSAGGGLSLSLLVRLRDQRQSVPNGAILLSPWADLTPAPRMPRGDGWLTPAHLTHWSAHYAGATRRENPELSPVLADLSRLPPLLILAGENELLLDDALRVEERAQRAGTHVRMIVGKRMQHDWPLTMPWLEESRQAWCAMRAFVDAHCTVARSADAGRPEWSGAYSL